MSAYWTCDRRGDCCRLPMSVTMTRAEQRAILHARPDAKDFIWHGDIDPKFVMLMARPCPLLSDDGSCTIYDVRPYNCRRFMCLREAGEPWITGPQDACVNAERRLATMPQAVAFYRTNQAMAQQWAYQHGWTEQMR